MAKLLLAAVAVPAAVAMSRVNPLSKKWQVDPAHGPVHESEWGHPEEKDGWYLAHNALRDEVQDMKDVLKHLKNRKLLPWEKESIATWWAAHLATIHAHHHSEDEIFTPFIETRVKYPRKLTTDHVGLVAQLNKMDALIRGGFNTATKLRAEWSTYERILKPHLREEELVGLPLLRAYFTPADVKPQVDKIIAKDPPLALGGFIRSMGGEGPARDFMAQEGIPFFVWYLVFKPGYQDYMAKVYCHIEALLSGTPPPPPPMDFTPLLKLLCLAGVAYGAYHYYTKKTKAS